MLWLSVLRLGAYVVVIPLACGSGVLAVVAATHIALMLATTGLQAAIVLSDVRVRLRDLGSAFLGPLVRAAACGLAAGVVARSLDGMALWVVLVPAVAAGGLVYAGLLFLTDRKSFVEAASVLARGSGVVRGVQ